MDKPAATGDAEPSTSKRASFSEPAVSSEAELPPKQKLTPRGKDKKKRSSKKKDKEKAPAKPQRSRAASITDMVTGGMVQGVMQGQEECYPQCIKLLTELKYAERNVRESHVAALREAKGVVFMTQIKAGFLVSGTVAAGFIICRTADGGWSAPSSLGAAGMGMGIQLGAQTTDILISLGTDEAVAELISSGRVRFGGDAHYTVPEALPGPSHGGSSHRGVGSSQTAKAVKAFSVAHGLFGGVSVDGMALVSREEDNSTVYGEPAPTVQEILSGKVTPIEDALEVYVLLNELLGIGGGQKEEEEAKAAAAQAAAAAEADKAAAAAARPLRCCGGGGGGGEAAE